MSERGKGAAGGSARRLGRSLGLGGALLLVGAALVGCGGQTPSVGAPTAQLEAEDGVITPSLAAQDVLDPRNGGRTIQDPAASGGHAVALLGEGDAVRFRLPGNFPPGRYTVKVRGRGQAYLGWPVVALENDRRCRMSTATLDTGRYGERGFGQFDLRPNQEMFVGFLNDRYDGPGKDRNAVVDYLVIEPVKTTPPAANRPPTITLKRLDNGDLPTPALPKYNPGHNVTLEADASDPDGKVARVEFYIGNNKIGEDTTAPYRFVYSNEGAFTAETEYPVVFSARAVDNLGATASTDTSQTNAVVGADFGNDGRSIASQPLRAINFGGPTTTQDGIMYTAGGAGGFTSNGTASVLPADRRLVPPVRDPNREAIIRSGISGAGPLSLALPLPNASYNVYLYVRAEDVTPYEIQLEGRSVSRFDPKEVGRWDKLGPFPASVGDGVLNVTTTGAARASFSAIEVWRRP